MYMYSLVILHQIGGRVGLSHEGRENFIVCGQTHVHCTCVRVAVHATKQVTWGGDYCLNSKLVMCNGKRCAGMRGTLL